MLGQILFPWATENSRKLLGLVHGIEMLFSFYTGMKCQIFLLILPAGWPVHLHICGQQCWSSHHHSEWIRFHGHANGRITLSAALGQGRIQTRALQYIFDWRNLYLDSWRLLHVIVGNFKRAKSLSFCRYFSLLSEATAFQGPQQFIHRKKYTFIIQKQTVIFNLCFTRHSLNNTLRYGICYIINLFHSITLVISTSLGLIEGCLSW